LTQLIATSKAEQSYSAADPWTAVHFSAGLGSGLIDMGFWRAMAAAVGYEVLEYYLQHDEIGQRFFKVSHPENAVNTVVDVAVFGVGWYLGRRWNGTLP
jgi:hypothetical protein